MLNRRKLLSWFTALPFMGVALRSTDGVALASAAHPVGTGVVPEDINPSSLTELELEFSVYAEAGETVTCENGHAICDFMETVFCGQRQDLKKQLGNWRQPEPKIGAYPIPGCAICGEAFTTGMHFHIDHEWRAPITRNRFHINA